MSGFAWAEHPEMVAFYKEHRSHPEDLYPSEQRFLPWLATQAATVLDVGCGAGGFKNIWQHYRPSIVYMGVDVSLALVVAARELYADSEFHQGDCAAGLPLSDGYADVVQALGWLHWELRYREAIRELWRLSRRYIFFDIRLVAEVDQAVVGKQKLAFSRPWDGETTTPYICVAWPLLARLLLGLQPVMLLGYGYWGKPSETVMGVDRPVCFATFVLEKAAAGRAEGLPSVCVDLPLTWPPALAPQVGLLHPSQLETLAPQT